MILVICASYVDLCTVQFVPRYRRTIADLFRNCHDDRRNRFPAVILLQTND